MKRLKLISSIATMFLFLFTSCYKSDEFTSTACKNIKIGEVKLSKRAKNFIPIREWKISTYVDRFGHEIDFVHTVTIEDGERINVNYLCSEDGYFDTTVNYYEYYKTYEKVNLMVSSDGEYTFRIRAYTVNEEESIDTVDERIMFSIAGSRVTGLYDIGKETFEDYLTNVMEKLDSVELNGKTFNDVLFVRDEDNNDALYLKEGEGIIGFKSKGKIFILK